MMRFRMVLVGVLGAAAAIGWTKLPWDQIPWLDPGSEPWRTLVVVSIHILIMSAVILAFVDDIAKARLPLAVVTVAEGIISGISFLNGGGGAPKDVNPLLAFGNGLLGSALMAGVAWFFMKWVLVKKFGRKYPSLGSEDDAEEDETKPDLGTMPDFQPGIVRKTVMVVTTLLGLGVPIGFLVASKSMEFQISWWLWLLFLAIWVGLGIQAAIWIQYDDLNKSLYRWGRIGTFVVTAYSFAMLMLWEKHVAMPCGWLIVISVGIAIFIASIVISLRLVPNAPSDPANSASGE